MLWILKLHDALPIYRVASVSIKEVAQYKDKEEDGDEGTTTSEEEIDGPNKNVEQDDNVSNRNKDVDR